MVARFDTYVGVTTQFLAIFTVCLFENSKYLCVVSKSHLMTCCPWAKNSLNKICEQYLVSLTFYDQKSCKEGGGRLL